MQKWMMIVLSVVLGVCLWLPGSAEAKGKKDSCRKADLKLALTGQGDSDGDGISDCREARYLQTDVQNPDTDDDGLNDGEDFGKACDPKDDDTDDDGVPDGVDPTPVVTQKMEALLDGLTCPTAEVLDPPTPAVPGSISALGATVLLDTATRFKGTSCADLASLFALGEGNLLVEVKILENVLGELHATSVELKQGCRRPDHHHRGWWGHHDDDDDDDDQGEDEDD